VARARRLEPPACLIAGGETTVTVTGRGKGGRCQEFALSAALELLPTDCITILAAGTDGTDGPTDAAGAIVDAGSVGRGAAAGADARQALKDNDAYRFLGASGDLLVSGPTRTNLLDLYVVLRS
jgi:glycerate-2-kinase